VVSLDNATERPPTGAAALKVVVQVLPASDVSDVGAQVSDFTDTGGARFRDTVMELPFNAAVMTAVRGLEIAAAVALNEPVVAVAAIVMLAGTVRLALLLVRPIAAPPVGAGPLKVTVQALVPGPVKAAGAHVRLLTLTVAVRVIVELLVAPLAAAVTVAVESAAITPAVVEKLAVVAPTATVTEAGVVNNPLLADSVTTVPPVGAALLSVTVQLLVPLDARVVGLQVNPVGIVGGRSPSEKVLEESFRLAVTVAVLAVVTAEAVAANTAVLLPAVTVTEDGVVSEVLLSDSATSAPPTAAASVKVTVQVDVAAPVIDAGLQLKADTSTEDGTVT
jgi:hypothetical protein